MKLISASYFQRSKNHGALLLQHYTCAAAPLCLACICPAETPDEGRIAAYLTERLLESFREMPWRKMLRDPDRHLFVAEEKLRRTIEKAAEELACAHLLPAAFFPPLAGILCVDESFLLFCQGSPRIYLLNRSFDRAYIQCISDGLPFFEKKTPAFCRGILQPDIGLLMGTESFFGCADEQELKDCLGVEEVPDEDRAQRHLRELGTLGEVRGGCGMGAVLLRTRKE